MGAWRHPGRIRALEARVVVGGLQPAGRRPSRHGRVFLSVGDNLSCILSFEKGRATNYELLA
eukprot:6219669-Alexandrium_andersonii.AAC.1